MSQLELGLYQHFKGTKVNVTAIALDSETRQPMVVYEHLEDGQVWVRSLAMFLETVTVNGQTVPRFKKVSD